MSGQADGCTFGPFWSHDWRGLLALTGQDGRCWCLISRFRLFLFTHTRTVPDVRCLTFSVDVESVGLFTGDFGEKKPETSFQSSWIMVGYICWSCIISERRCVCVCAGTHCLQPVQSSCCLSVDQSSRNGGSQNSTGLTGASFVLLVVVIGSQGEDGAARTHLCILQTCNRQQKLPFRTTRA